MNVVIIKSGLSHFQTKKYADVIIPRGADNTGRRSSWLGPPCVCVSVLTLCLLGGFLTKPIGYLYFVHFVVPMGISPMRHFRVTFPKENLPNPNYS